MIRFPAAAFLLFASITLGAPSQPNIVFVLVDDMGYADLGCTGSTDIRTPHIDRLAAEGVRFTDFYANAPVCTPTRVAFMTGRWQQRTGIEFAFGYQVEQWRKVGGDWVPEPDIHGLGLPASETTVAQRLHDAGYATGAFGKWHLGYRDEYNPLHRGFDEYFGELLGHADYYRHAYYDGTRALRDGLEPVQAEGYFTDLVNERAVRFLRAHGGKQPFFLYVPHLAVHAPFQAPDAPETAMVTKETMFDGSREVYRTMLERVDHGMGLILAELERLGVAENTLIVLSSDNGGERYANNAPFFHHKATLWEGGIRVPCLMRWPARLPKGTLSSAPAVTMDLHATFLAAAGVPAPQDRPLDGIDLLPLALGQAEPPDRVLCWRMDRSNRKMKAIRRGTWKHVNDGNTMDLLFDLANDPGERINLAYRHPDILRDLKELLARWETDLDASEPEIRVR